MLPSARGFWFDSHVETAVWRGAKRREEKRREGKRREETEEEASDAPAAAPATCLQSVRHQRGAIALLDDVVGARLGRRVRAGAVNGLRRARRLGRHAGRRGARHLVVTSAVHWAAVAIACAQRTRTIRIHMSARELTDNRARKPVCQ